MIYWQLILSFLKIGLFGFGGGLAVISLIQHEVLSYGWMTEQEFVDIVAISQVTPGPIGINCATYVGYTATGSVWVSYAWPHAHCVNRAGTTELIVSHDSS